MPGTEAFEGRARYPCCRGSVGTGRQFGLKIRCPQGRRGSSPLSPTNIKYSLSLTGPRPGLYRDASRGAVAQLGEHKAGSLGVRGSNPLSSTISSPSEIQPLHLRVGEQPLARPREAVLAELQDVAAVGDPDRPRGVLLDHHQREAVALHLEQLVEDQRHELRRQPE